MRQYPFHGRGKICCFFALARRGGVVFAVLAVLASASGSTQYILKSSDGYGSSSFNSAGNWVTNGTSSSATTAPAAGGVYDTGTCTLRTPADVSSTFAGDSLTLSPASSSSYGSMMLKGSNGATITVSNLIMAGGMLSSGGNTGSAGIGYVAGSISVASNSSVSGLGYSNRYIGITSKLSGQGSLSNDCYVIYSGNNTNFTGPMIVGSGGMIQISDSVNLGGNPTNAQSAQLLLNSGTLMTVYSVALTNSNSGVTLGSGGGVFTNTSGTTLTISNAVTGSGSLTFVGSGGMVLAGTCSYTGATLVTNGSLSFLSTKTGTGNISISNGVTLGITDCGTQITPSTLVLGSSAAVTIQFNNVTNTSTAPLAATTMTTGGTVNFKIASGTFSAGKSYPLLKWTSGNMPTAVLAQLSGATGYLSTNGNSIQLNVSSVTSVQTASLKFEAESGVLGNNFAISNSSTPVYITVTNDAAGYAPSNSARVATYTVTFPSPGIYYLYARVQVGSGGYADDSLFLPNGFGAQDVTNTSDWTMVNGLAGVGFTNPTDIVTGSGTVGNSVWKWINLSLYASLPYTVTNGALTQIFQIGGRENGLCLDAFMFGMKYYTYTVTNLDAGVDGTPPAAGTGTLNWSNVLQKIDGFGGGAVFLDSGLDPLSSSNMDTLFCTNSTNQLGLTLLRVRIDPSTNWSTALTNAQRAVARGASVMATPWTPPASMKSNTNTVGGSLATNQYAAYANYLNSFAGYMKSNGVQLAAVSIQNEPDYVPDYEGCSWTSNQFLAFFRTNACAITNAPVMMPESFGYNQAVSEPTLNDSIAVTNVAIVGLHLYGATITDYTNAHTKGIPTWMTEYLVNDQSIYSAVDTAAQIHDCLVTGNMSAYIWWKTIGDTNGLINAAGTPQKRGFVMSQFSRFIRPGYRRIGSTNTGTVLITAYRDTNTSGFVIVAINPTVTNLTPTINLSNFPSISTVTPWITSSNLSLAAQSDVTVTNAAFSYTLPAVSIVTFVGQAVTNSAPTLSAVADQTLDAGVTLLVTNTATDADISAQTLTFSLLSAPTNASLSAPNATNALITWRPLVSQAGTTNLFSVKVSDSGSPSLSATNQFTVIVNPLGSLPSFGTVSAASGTTLSFTVTGPSGPDYVLLMATNLSSSWQVLISNSSPETPFTWTVTNQADPARFYRVQIGP